MNLEQLFIKTSQISVLCLNSKEIQNKSLGEKTPANATFTNGIQDGINTVACSFNILFCIYLQIAPQIKHDLHC